MTTLCISRTKKDTPHNLCLGIFIWSLGHVSFRPE